MIKYKKVDRRRSMFELIKVRKIRNTKLAKKRKLADKKFLRLPNFIVSIIHKLNYFDLVIIFLILLVFLFLIINRFRRKNEWVDIRVSVENSDWWYQGSPPRVWYGSDLKAGEKAKNSYGQDVAEIVKIENYDIGGPYRNIYLDIKLKVVFDKNRNQYLYEFKPLVVGSSIVLNYPNQQVRGLIVNIGKEKVEQGYQIVKLQKRSFQNITSAITTTNSVTSSVTNKPITPEFANSIKIGDKSYDNNNDLIAEVLDIKNTISSYYEYSDIRGINILTHNPLYRDLELIVKLKFNKIAGLNFYIQAPIKIGSQIWVQFPNYSLEDYEIVEIIE